MEQNNCLEEIPSSSSLSKNTDAIVLNPGETLRDTVRKLLNEEKNNQKPPDTDPETFKAALDAVRFEHQRLQNEFMTLMIVNEHVQQKLDALSENNVQNEQELNLEDI